MDKFDQLNTDADTRILKQQFIRIGEFDAHAFKKDPETNEETGERTTLLKKIPIRLLALNF